MQETPTPENPPESAAAAEPGAGDNAWELPTEPGDVPTDSSDLGTGLGDLQNAAEQEEQEEPAEKDPYEMEDTSLHMFASISNYSCVKKCSNKIRKFLCNLLSINKFDHNISYC